MSTTHNRIQTESLEITEAGGVKARRFVTFAGDYAGADGDAVYGVARTDGANGEIIAVDVQGRLEVEAAAAIAAGATLESDDAGRAQTRTGTHTIAGYALTAATAAGETIEIVRGI